MTARTLETMIRLATAHAKAHLSPKITAEDANIAVELIQYAYFKKVLEKETKKRKKDSGASDDDGDDQHSKRTRVRVSNNNNNNRSVPTKVL